MIDTYSTDPVLPMEPLNALKTGGFIFITLAVESETIIRPKKKIRGADLNPLLVKPQNRGVSVISSEISLKNKPILYVPVLVKN